MDFLSVHSTLIELVVLIGFTLSIAYYVLFTLIFEFICFAQEYNERHNKLEADLRHNFQLDGLSARLRRVCVCVIAYAYTYR